MKASRIVCVLGPARSGTSLTMRLLAYLGVDLGPQEHLHQARSFNEKGSWEHRSLGELNREILARLAGPDWRWSLPQFLPGWADAPELWELQRRARATIERDFGAAPIWGWKHPETCLTLPFWQAILLPMQYAICLRDSREVATSSTEKFGVTFEQGLHLWLRYLLSALEHTKGHQRVLIFYEDWFRDDANQLEDLARLLGADRALTPNSKHLAQEYIDRSLWRHRSPASADREPEAHPGTDLLRVVLPLYEDLHREKRFGPALFRGFREACEVVGREAARAEAASKQAEREAWERELRDARRDLTDFIPAGESFILVDDGTIPRELFQQWHVVPFREREGLDWGPPEDSVTAIRELEQMRESGARFVVFARPAFWWLEHYAEFREHLGSTGHRVLANQRLVVFDLAPEPRQ